MKNIIKQIESNILSLHHWRARVALLLMAIVMMILCPTKLWADNDKPWLCFTAQQAGSKVLLNKSGTPAAITFETSTDGTNWTTYKAGSTGNITLANVGDKVYFRNQSEDPATSFTKANGSNYYRFVMSGKIAASGNTMSLMDKSCATTAFDPEKGKFAFCGLFYQCDALTIAPDLPATTLAENCYYSMFTYDKNLTTIPNFPAQDLPLNCYAQMFYQCKALNMNTSGLGYAWSIPAGGEKASSWGAFMFFSIGSSFPSNGLPTPGTTYYLASTPSVTLNSKGYATYSTYFDAKIATDGVKAYTVATNGGDATLTELNGDIPAGTGVVLKGTPNTIVSFTASSSHATIAEGTNLMIPATITPCVIEARPATGYTYKLVGNNLVKTTDEFSHNSAYLTLDNDTYDKFYLGSKIVSTTVDGTTTYYETIEEAFDAAKVEGQTSTVTLLEDYTTPAPYPSYSGTSAVDLTVGNITLDLNGHKISSACENGILVNGANLTIVDNSEEKNGEVSAYYYGVKFISGALTINDGKFSGTYYGLNALYYSSGTIVLRGGTFTDIRSSRSILDLSGCGFFDANNKLVLFPKENYFSKTVTVKNLEVENVGITVTKNGATTYYAEVMDAFAAASTGTAEAPATVKLLSDYADTSTSETFIMLTSGVMTLDLNDHKLSTACHETIRLAGADLTVVDNGAEKKGEVSSSYDYSVALQFFRGKLTVNDGKFVGNSHGLNTFNYNSGSVVLRGGTFTGIQTMNYPSNDWSMYDMTNYGFFDTDNELIQSLDAFSISKTVTVKNLEDENVGVTVTKNGATTYYAIIKQAFAAASTGTTAIAPATVKLLSDYADTSSKYTSYITLSSGNIILDLNDHKISTGCSEGIRLNGADLTIIDNGAEKKGELSAKSESLYYIGGSLTVKGGKFVSNSFALYTSATTGSIVLRGGIFTSIRGKRNLFNMDGCYFEDVDTHEILTVQGTTSFDIDNTVEVKSVATAALFDVQVYKGNTGTVAFSKQSASNILINNSAAGRPQIRIFGSGFDNPSALDHNTRYNFAFTAVPSINPGTGEINDDIVAAAKTANKLLVTIPETPDLTGPALVLQGSDTKIYYLDEENPTISLIYSAEGKYVVNGNEVEGNVSFLYFLDPHHYGLGETADAATGLYPVECVICNEKKAGVKAIKDFAPNAEGDAKHLELNVPASGNPYTTQAINLTDANQFAGFSGKDFVFETTAATTPTYTRTMTSEWGTLVLPFGFNTGDVEGYAFYEIDAAHTTGSKLALKPIKGVIDTEDCVFVRKITETDDPLVITASGENANCIHTDLGYSRNDELEFKLIGTYEIKSLTDGFVINNNLFWSVSYLLSNNNVSSVKIAPFRFYLEDDSSISDSKLNIVVVDDAATGIGNIENMEFNNSAVFNIQGQKLTAPQKGINIINGKKIMVK